MRIEPFPLQDTIAGGARAGSLGELFARVRRRWFTMSLAFALCLLGGLVIHSLQTPVYRAAAVILIDPAGNDPWTLSPGAVTNASNTWSNYVDSQIEVLQSREIADAVTEALGLADDRSWTHPQHPGQVFADSVGALSPPAGDWASSYLASAPIEPAEQLAANQLLESVTISRRGASFAVEVSVDTPDPDLSAAIANATVSAYFQWRAKLSTTSDREANSSLGDHLKTLQADLAAKTQAVEDFRQQARINTVHSSEQLTEAQMNLAAAERAFSELESRYLQALSIYQSGQSLNETERVLDSPLLQQLRIQYADLTKQHSQLSAKYGPAHPDMQVVQSELESARREISAETSRLITSLSNEVEAGRRQVAALEQRRRELSGSLLQERADEAKLHDLEREAEAARDVSQTFMRRMGELSNTQFTDPTRISSLSVAVPDHEPVSPNLAVTLLASVVAGLTLAFLLALARDALDQRLRTARSIVEATGMTLLSTAPRLEKSKLRLCAPSERHPAGYLMEFPDTRFAESYRLLRHSLEGRTGRTNSLSVAITSAWSGEGKSTAALCLARAAALAGERVALIDCDLRRRSLNDLLNIQPDIGLLQVLKEEVHWRDAVGMDESGVTVLPSAAVPYTPSHLLTSFEMDELLADMKQHFSLIVLDTPPLLLVAEARGISARCDSIVVVARSGATTRTSLAAVCNQLYRVRDKVAGVLLNGVKATRRPTVSYYDAIAFEPLAA